MSNSHASDDNLSDELSKKASEFRALQQVSSDINATLDLDEIYDIVLRTMDELFGFHHAIILVLDEPPETLTVVASHGYEDQPIGGKTPVGVGVIGVVAKRRRIMRVGNLGQQRAYASAVRREAEAAGQADQMGEAIPVPGLPDAESQIAIPLLVRDTLIGVFSVQSRRRTTFTEHDEDLVAIVANQAASAIHNARLYRDVEDRRQELAEAHERLQRLNETLEMRVRERTAELEETNHELRDTQAQLVQSGKMASLGMLVAGIAHEINTPIGAISAVQDNLNRAVAKLKDALEARDGEPPGGSAAVRKSVEAIEAANKVVGKGATHVGDIVKRLRSFARLDEADLQRTNIHECVEETLALIQHELRDDIQVTRDFGEIPEVLCYPSRLNQVFLNVLHNACQAIDGKGEIVITSRLEGNHVHVAFRDNGSGIAEKDIAKVFDPGFTSKGVGVGTGLGLAICYQIMRDHRGSIDVDSKLGEGSTFTVVLPVGADG
jgi:signal transduction histidine kinase